jgi:hypothetical protein
VSLEPIRNSKHQRAQISEGPAIHGFSLMAGPSTLLVGVTRGILLS